MFFWDILGGIGIYFVLLKFSNTTFQYWHLFLAIIFPLLPDIDFIIWLKRNNWKINKWAHEHRDLLHFPLLYIPIGYILAGIIGGKFIANLFFYCSMYHFAHDSFGIGWGIKWLFPFSFRNYKLFEKKGSEKRKFLVSWNKEELRKEVEIRGKDDWWKKI
jgi:hypothetical protein